MVVVTLATCLYGHGCMVLCRQRPGAYTASSGEPFSGGQLYFFAGHVPSKVIVYVHGLVARR